VISRKRRRPTIWKYGDVEFYFPTDIRRGDRADPPASGRRIRASGGCSPIFIDSMRRILEKARLGRSLNDVLDE
jgi:hypothetical protein